MVNAQAVDDGKRHNAALSLITIGRRLHRAEVLEQPDAFLAAISS